MQHLSLLSILLFLQPEEILLAAGRGATVLSLVITEIKAPPFRTVTFRLSVETLFQVVLTSLVVEVLFSMVFVPVFRWIM